jgi:hypothetical protein
MNQINLPAHPNPKIAAAADKIQRHNDQVRRQAAKPIAQHMNDMGFYEMFRDEVPSDLFDSWCVLWNIFDPEGLKNSITFSYRKIEYVLTRYA